jgi:hypothetical protein
MSTSLGDLPSRAGRARPCARFRQPSQRRGRHPAPGGDDGRGLCGSVGSLLAPRIAGSPLIRSMLRAAKSRSMRLRHTASPSPSQIASASTPALRSCDQLRPHLWGNASTVRNACSMWEWSAPRPAARSWQSACAGQPSGGRSLWRADGSGWLPATAAGAARRSEGGARRHWLESKRRRRGAGAARGGRRARGETRATRALRRRDGLSLKRSDTTLGKREGEAHAAPPQMITFAGDDYRQRTVKRSLVETGRAVMIVFGAEQRRKSSATPHPPCVFIPLRSASSARPSAGPGATSSRAPKPAAPRGR